MPTNRATRELNRFSPSFDFPMGRSFYAAIRLPRSQGVYGLRIRSFANRQVVYPSLLFLTSTSGRPGWSATRCTS